MKFINKEERSLSSLIYWIIASVVFIIGIAFYYYFREPTIVEVFLNIDHPTVLLPYTNYLNWYPSFAHVFSFSIFTWLLLEKQYENYSILFWMVLNIIVEFGQMLDTPIGIFPINIQYYFIVGTFCWWDIVAIILGGTCVKLLIANTENN